MTEKIKKNFNINDEDIDKHAHIVYHAIQEYYIRVGKLIDILSDDPRIKQEMRSRSTLFGILPSKRIRYEKTFLQNDEFKVSVIYHLCFSNVLCCNLSWEAYLYVHDMFQSAFMKSSDESISVDSIMLKSFKVNPNILPKSYLAKTMKVDEFNKAVTFIYNRIQQIRSFNKTFSDYDDYFEYVKIQAFKITKACHDMELYGTHEIDRFTCACIASRMKIPAIDVLYNIEIGNDKEYKPDVDVETIKDMQRDVFKKIKKISDDDKFD